MNQRPKTPKALVLAVLLAIFALALVPREALASTGTCTMNGVDYESLADAVAAVPDGTPSTIVLTSDHLLDKTVVIPEGKDVTISNGSKRRTVDFSDAASGPLFSVQGKLTLDGSSFSDLDLVGSDASTGASVALVSGNGHLVLGSATVRGGNLNKEGAGAIKVTGSATFDLTKGLVTSTVGNNPLGSAYTAPVVVTDSATMNMTGGEISDNTAKADFACSGIIVVGTNGSAPVLNMSAGAINSNTANDCSAVYVLAGAQFNLSGGMILYNTATNSSDGSAVIVDNKGEMKMTGGLVEMNEGQVSTIAVIQDARATFSGGTIRYNSAKTAGGAIFAVGNRTNIEVNNAIVHGNKATIMGGGLWYCPTGAGSVSAKSGMAIFSNTADGAGDDFVSLFTGSGKVADIDLSNRVLGGGTAAYYQDGMVQPGTPISWNGEVVTTVPRFDAANPGDPVVVQGPESECVSLKTVISDRAIESAKDSADFAIYGNEAPYGGGIACNGILTSGIQEITHDVTVSKQDGAQANVAGAQLQVTNDSGLVFDEWTSEADADHILQLPAGTYTLTELSAPEGYESADPITFTVDADGNVTIAGEAVDKVVMIDEAITEDGGGEGDGGTSSNGGDNDGGGSKDQVEKNTVSRKGAVTGRYVTPQTGDANNMVPAVLCVLGVALVGTRALASRREDR